MAGHSTFASRAIAALMVTLMLSFTAACTTTTQTKIITQMVGVNPPKELYDCYKRKINIPDPDTLTDRQTGKFIVDSQRIIAECQSDARHLDKYLNETNSNIRKIQTKKR